MSAVTVTEPAAVAAPEQVSDDHVIVLFGATGDLARRKLLPGIFHLMRAGLMPPRFRLIGAARRDIGDEEFVEMAREAIESSGRRSPSPEVVDRFVGCLRFVGVGDGLEAVADAVEAAREDLGRDARVLFYLSLPPSAAGPTARRIGDLGLDEGARVITEKPFGIDLESARDLNACLLSVFREEDIFRIDHYLGREAVQNLLALRFANGMFEPVWNRNHIDHIQIDVPETLSIGMRAGFYEETGAFRDMVVTHLFQVLSFVAMEPPTSLRAKALMLEREKVFDSMAPLDPAGVVRGQYEGYRDEEGVARDSDTETLVALRAFIDNWRWDGVPFYLRSGKRMAEDRHILTVAFKQPPRRMFPLDCSEIAESFGHDHLTFELGEPGSISASFLAKVPGPTIHLGEAHMRFNYADNFGENTHALDPYERLIHDVMSGDRTLFTSSEGIERLWAVSEPLLEEPPPVEAYPAGSWGPPAIDELIAPRRWHLPSTHVD
ncbi:MAG TPA: glucose-6-phosphate dehydrogenase [Solirubrobacterales bacterium]|nr:glucose-6-phosphate dehydrogenase [Solirubrobacterales bacterium]